MSNNEKVINIQNLEVFKSKIFENIKKIDAPQNFNIAVSDWQPLSSAVNGYSYCASVAVENLTANDYARIDFSFASISTCITAEISPVGETENGNLKLYAKNIPDSAISGVYIIRKGAL